MPPFACILFDLDNTLVDGDRLPRAKAGSLLPGGDTAGNPVVPFVFEAGDGGMPLTPHLLDPATPAVFEALRAHGATLGVVTSAPRWAAVRVLRSTQLLPLVSRCLVTAEGTRLRKPHPAPLRRALHLLRATPEEALYVGDSLADAVAARACGVAFALAGWSPTVTERTDIPHDWPLERISDLPALVGISEEGGAEFFVPPAREAGREGLR